MGGGLRKKKEKKGQEREKEGEKGARKGKKKQGERKEKAGWWKGKMEGARKIFPD